MRVTSARVVVVAAALLVSAAPVLAQDAGHTVGFDGIGFTFDRSLGSSIDIATVPPVDPEASIPEGPDAGHITFTFFGRRAEGRRPPQIGYTDGVVRVYRVADLADYQFLPENADQLRTLLEKRLDLSTFMTSHGTRGVDPLPLLGLYGAAAVLQARAEYVDAPGVSGIAYVGAYAQDVAPLDSGSFWYVFQGLSPDGETYVSVTWVLDTALFPKEPNVRNYDAFVKGYPGYVNQSIAKLNAADAADFTPDLSVLDALVRSITLSGSTEVSPSPAVIPSASPAGSPAA